MWQTLHDVGSALRAIPPWSSSCSPSIFAEVVTGVVNGCDQAQAAEIAERLVDFMLERTELLIADGGRRGDGRHAGRGDRVSTNASHAPLAHQERGVSHMTDMLTLHLFGDVRARAPSRAAGRSGATKTPRSASATPPRRWRAPSPATPTRACCPSPSPPPSAAWPWWRSRWRGATVYTGVPAQPVQPAPRRRGPGRARR